ncbi:uncharacterized protein FIESC28_07125 [Fusarium coffeatum]|uniref:Uncharacterized protein n=1 Tax=Fusarium coffeatum TaxID=231269 RepID=A0A366RFL1_9HYPO|nr:uncharacterized protein FIESC28_07125 [Fusarium coffeatum]RBR15923.1 hypothetical protein FIESC28_07125 [Fusarium coffeatum]
MEGTFHLNNLWAKAYEKVQESEHAEDLEMFENYLQKQPSEAQQCWVESVTQNRGRLKRIQIMAKEKLEDLPEARTSFTLGGKRIVVREHIQKAIQTIKQFKPIISGALSAEPQAALAWACIMGFLPIMENLFQKDEDAADGLTKILFMLVRFQNLEESVLTHDSEAASQTTSTSTHELLSNIETKLIDIYQKVYLYQIRFVLQYGQGKWRRNIGGLLKPEDWKQKWKEIDTSRQLVDQAVRDRLGARTIDTWAAVKEIETTTIETLKAMYELDSRMKQMDIKEQATQERDMLLKLPIAADAAFDSAKVLSAQSYCLEGTQHDILCKIGDWAEDPGGELIFWLYSMAGTGKSSIALTVADALKQRRSLTTGRSPPRTAFLGASFFFKQVDNTRNGIQRFFTTVAWRLAETFDDFKPLVAQAVNNNLTIGTKAPQQQLQHLLADTLAILDQKTYLPIRLIVVVDALDECLDRGQAKELISLLAMQLKDLQKVQLRILVTSRREEHIQQAFSQLEEGSHLAVPLKKIKLDAEGDNDDITRYIRSTLRAVARQHGCEEDEVSTTTIKQLSEKSNGLFIYAATACRFLDAGDFADPLDRQDRLDLILETSTDTDDWGDDGPQNQIDDIYLKVLSFPAREKLSPTARRMTYEIMKNTLGFLVTVFQPVTILSLEGFVESVFKGSGVIADRLARLLKKLQAIVTIPTDKRSPLELMHLSFRDFILSKERTQHLMFQVDEAEIHKKAFLYCLDVMSNELRRDICDLKWPGTMASEIPGERIEEHIQPPLRLWSLVEPLEHQQLSGLIYDMRRFALINRWIIENAPLQIYVSTLVFSPKTSLIRNLFQSHIPNWIVQQPVVDDQWTLELSVIQGHTMEVDFVAFSPAGDLILSLSDDRTARLWDTVTGTERFKFESSTDYTFAAFSLDGESVAFGCWDGSVYARQLAGGAKFQFDGHDGWVRQVTYSPRTGKMLASAAEPSSFKIWTIDQRHARHVLPKPTHPRKYWNGACGFTPDEQYLITVEFGQDITIWDTQNGHCIRTFDNFPPASVRELTISLNDSMVAICTREDTVKIFNVLTGEHEIEYCGRTYWQILSPPNGTSVWAKTKEGDIVLLDSGHTSGLERFSLSCRHRRAALSRDGKLLASCGYSNNFRLWDMQSKTTVDKEPTKDEGHIHTLTLSPNKSLVYCPTWDQSITIARDLEGRQLTLPYLEVRRIEFSPDGKFVSLRITDQDDVEEDEDDKRVLSELWDVTMTTKVLACRQWKGVFFSPTGTYIAMITTEGEAEVFHFSRRQLKLAGNCEHELDSPYPGIAFSTTGKLLATTSWMKEHNSTGTLFQLWDVESGSELGRYIVKNEITDLSFSNDTHLVCDRGQLPLPLSKPAIGEDHWNVDQEDSKDLLYVGDEWLYRGSERLMWLPVAYRSEASHLVGDTLVLSHESDNIRVMRFNLAAIPVRDSRTRRIGTWQED